MENKIFYFENLNIRVEFEKADNSSLSGKKLIIEYYNLLLERNNYKFDHISSLQSVLRALFTDKFNVRTLNSFKKELKKAGILLNDDKFYYIIKNDAKNGIITKKMLEMLED